MTYKNAEYQGARTTTSARAQEQVPSAGDGSTARRSSTARPADDREQNAVATVPEEMSPSQTRSIVPTPSTVSSKRTHEARCGPGDALQSIGRLVDRAFFSSRKRWPCQRQESTSSASASEAKGLVLDDRHDSQTRSAASVAHYGDAVLPDALRVIGSTAMTAEPKLRRAVRGGERLSVLHAKGELAGRVLVAYLVPTLVVSTSGHGPPP